MTDPRRLNLAKLFLLSCSEEPTDEQASMMAPELYGTVAAILTQIEAIMSAQADALKSGLADAKAAVAGATGQMKDGLEQLNRSLASITSQFADAVKEKIEKAHSQCQTTPKSKS